MEELPVPLVTTARLRALAPDPPATVRIQNLSTVLQYAGHDAWGRACKPQPALISAEVAFVAPFSAAAVGDTVSEDTVHYGSLSKSILASLKETEAIRRSDLLDPREDEYCVGHALASVWHALTGLTVKGTRGNPERVPFLDLKKVRLMSLTMTLPKASLLGEGVSLTASAVFEEGTGKMQARAESLEISRLTVPTLIGVNANERLAKQLVVLTVAIEGFGMMPLDIYTEIEEVVVKAMESSHFKTLEALGARIAERVLTCPSLRSSHQDSGDGLQVCVRMEKPIAVPMADCPIVEVRATLASLMQGRAERGA
ncbi:hypothetical protein C8A03DRAFT_33304 [Achaetomium macrosporum]|uniref:Dihydroneopterin aldolase/epimerase domain-containing protein n=1 Tax=Achaetomium macrosporum TaxID=79813 RepID=A0AAN7HCP0_9PEZI|nr:hypothetical protein C8A03DRAFT_33304 [Achaetomium macrosporum]